MNLGDIEQHWRNWAVSFGKDLRATTKGRTAKMIEVAALGRVIDLAQRELGRPLDILEVGCGNGFNCSWIAQNFPQSRVLGVDYIPEMIEAAKLRQAEDSIPADRLTYQTGNALDLSDVPGSFDLVFTNRCLINLNTWDLQAQAYAQLISKVRPGGYVATIENSVPARLRQDQLRKSAGLPERPIDKFNTFFEADALENLAKEIGLQVICNDHVSTLHDLMLYVLLPMTNGGIIDYEHPLVSAAAQINIELTNHLRLDLGAVGQNFLLLCRKPQQD